MRRATITAEEFNSLRRQLPPAKLRLLVKRIERDYREALGVMPLTRDEIVVATLDKRGQTAPETAGLRVIRTCIGYRESLIREGETGAIWLDEISRALSATAHQTIAGQVAIAGRARGLEESKKTRTEKAAERDAELRAGAQELRAKNPHLSNGRLADFLAARHGGSAEVIRKKLPRLLRD